MSDDEERNGYGSVMRNEDRAYSEPTPKEERIDDINKPCTRHTHLHAPWFISFPFQ